MRHIPPDLLAKIMKQNQTIYENADPRMSIQVSRAKTTITDSTYWTVETIRTKEGLGDLSVAARRFKPYGGPNRLYNIYVDNGIVKTAIREYPDYRGEKWQTQFELGQGSAVAIAFDGHWEWYRKKWQPVTVEDPFIFWVDNSKKLWVQTWDDESTKYELSTNVNKVKALRGWKNVNIAHNDQGVVAAYIKTDGSVYYRNYCVQENGLVVWENERELEEFTGVAVNLNLFITNDYRMGIIVQDNQNGIWLYITDRNWAGMAIHPEYFSVRASATAELIPIRYWRTTNYENFVVTCGADVSFLYGASFNEFTEITQIGLEDEEERFEVNEGLNYGVALKIYTKHKFTEVSASGFELYDENEVRFRGVSYLGTEDDAILIGFEDFNNAEGDLTLYNLEDKNKNEAGYYFGEFSESFTPINLISELIGPPELEAIWNE